MRKYSHLLTLGRSKCLSTSTKRWVHESSPIKLHRPRHLQPRPPPSQLPPPSPYSHLSRIRRLQPPPPPLPPASRYSHLPRIACRETSLISHAYPPNTLSQVTGYRHNSQLSTLQTPELPSAAPVTGAPPLDYHVTVKGSFVVSATHAPAHELWLPLSNLDLLLPPLEAGVFFCYKKKDDDGMSPESVVETVKRSLAAVLSTFYPLAGEIVANSQGEPEVLCNNRGVEFVHAHADVELEKLDFHHPDESVKGKLVPHIKHGALSVQVTEFRCGSMVISCSFDHRVADAHSLNMFLVAWAESAQSKPISTVPSFRPSNLNPRHPAHHDKTLDNLYIPISSLPSPSCFEDQLHGRIYYIHSESLHRLQSEASTKDTRRSKLRSFTAFLWKLFAQANENDGSKSSRMGLIVNGRKFLMQNGDKESSSFDNHFGNVLSIPYGEEAVGDLKVMPLNEVAGKVDRFVAVAAKEEHFRALVDWVELHRPEPAATRVYFRVKETDGEAVVVSSGLGLPVKEMDFGWGKPEFGSYHFPWGGQTGYITTMPSARINGDWVVYMHLKQSHLDLIESKAPHVFKPLTKYYSSV